MLQLTPEMLTYLRRVQEITNTRLAQKQREVREAREKKNRRLNPDRRKHFVSLTARIMRAAKDEGKAATLLNFEGPCRHALRSRFCLEGWKWRDADTTANDIVQAALIRVGAERPDWEEGQPEYSQTGAGALIERTLCVRCHTPLEGHQRKYCSVLCKNVHGNLIRRRRDADETRAYDLISNPHRINGWKR